MKFVLDALKCFGVTLAFGLMLCAIGSGMYFLMVD